MVKPVRRALHIAVTIVTILLLVRPYDCFAGVMTRKAAACCAKGKCLPTPDADDCCKSTTPSDTQFVASKPHLQTNPVVCLAAVLVSDIAPSPMMLAAMHIDRAYSPPESPPGLHRNLPLVI